MNIADVYKSVPRNQWGNIAVSSGAVTVNLKDKVDTYTFTGQKDTEAITGAQIPAVTLATGVAKK
jgi:hypothetical protein